MVVAKRLAIFLLIYLLAFILVHSLPEFIHRRAFDQAFSAYEKNPTPENEAAFRFQRHVTAMVHLEDSVTITLVLVGGGYGVYGAVLLVRGGAKRLRKLASES
jgi:hypothetical protein